MGVAICRRCANYSSSRLGVTETTENSRWFLISCFTWFRCPCHHAMPAILPVTPWSICQYWPRKPHLHTERQGLLQSLFIDEETEILIVEWPVGHGHPAAACSAVWESRGSAFRVHSGVDWFCLHGSWQFSARDLLQLDLVFTPPVSRLILSSPVFAFLTHLPSPVPVFFSPSHISVWEPALVGVKMLSESDVFLAAHKVASP